jgi:hypothetical protein
MFNISIRSLGHTRLVGIPRKGDRSKCVILSNQLLRKMKYPAYQQQLGRNALCITCNYKFMTQTRGWADNLKAICHPFRDTSIFPKDKQLHLFSESDFIDELWVNAERGKGSEKKYDFGIFTIDTLQGIKCKGHYSIPYIIDEAHKLGMRGFVHDYYPTSSQQPNLRDAAVGSDAWALKKTRKRFKRCPEYPMIRGIRTQKQLSKMMHQCRFIIFPNTADASPRMIPETLIRGVPIMLNKNIYGGWKYLTDNNGIFYDGANNFGAFERKKDYYLGEIRKALQTISSRKYDLEKIKTEYYEQYGFFKSARRLAGIINGLEGKNLYSHVFYKGFQRPLKRWQLLEK